MLHFSSLQKKKITRRLHQYSKLAKGFPSTQQRPKLWWKLFQRRGRRCHQNVCSFKSQLSKRWKCSSCLQFDLSRGSTCRSWRNIVLPDRRSIVERVKRSGQIFHLLYLRGILLCLLKMVNPTNMLLNDILFFVSLLLDFRWRRSSFDSPRHSEPVWRYCISNVQLSPFRKKKHIILLGE